MSGHETLAVTRCCACGTIAVWPRHACEACGAIEREAGFANGGGLIRSVTVIHRPPDSGGVAAPYAVALISFDVGGTLMARVPLDTHIGDRIDARRVGVADLPEVTVSAVT